MQLASLIISLCLHVGFLLAVVYWPGPAPLRLDSAPIMISLVDGAPGGNATPSPILGHVGDPGEGKPAPSAPAPKQEIAAPAVESVAEAAPVRMPDARHDPQPKPEPVRPKPVPVPEEAIPVAEKKEEEAKKPEPEKTPPEPPKEEPKKPDPKKEEPRKEEPKKEEAKKEQPKTPPKKPAPKRDPVAEALEKARRQASSRADAGDRGNAIEQALAAAQRKSSGNRGGGGGEGDGPGGGGLGDVYMGQVMLAVRPNWGFATPGRQNLACVVKVRVEADGRVLAADISQSSGNPQFDASAVNAVMRTGRAGEFPPPPSAEYHDLDLVFTLNEMMGR